MKQDIWNARGFRNCTKQALKTLVEETLETTIHKDGGVPIVWTEVDGVKQAHRTNVSIRVSFERAEDLDEFIR